MSRGPGQIMLWWTPERGELYGYVDGRTQTGDAFYFSGTGQEGDQHFDAPYVENRRLRDHALTGDSVRLLRYVAKNRVVYCGELRVDPKTRGSCPTSGDDGHMRACSSASLQVKGLGRLREAVLA